VLAGGAASGLGMTAAGAAQQAMEGQDPTNISAGQLGANAGIGLAMSLVGLRAQRGEAAFRQASKARDSYIEALTANNKAAYDPATAPPGVSDLMAQEAALRQQLAATKSEDAQDPLKAQLLQNLATQKAALDTGTVDPGALRAAQANARPGGAPSANGGQTVPGGTNPAKAAPVGAATPPQAPAPAGSSDAGKTNAPDSGAPQQPAAPRPASTQGGAVSVPDSQGKDTEQSSGPPPSNITQFQSLKAQLRAEMSKPNVVDPELYKLTQELYRDGSTIGSGSTAAAVRQETQTGKPVGNRFHTQKAQNAIVFLEKWLAKNENNPKVAPGDRAAAQNMILDMRDALKTKP
jgi:hypothetical protein